jgi:hypothetical protein
MRSGSIGLPVKRQPAVAHPTLFDAAACLHDNAAIHMMRRAVKRVLIVVNRKHQNAAGAFRVRGFTN